MAVSIKSVKISGLKELEKALQQLTEPKFRKAALRAAGKQSMKPVFEDAKRRAPMITEPGRYPNEKAGILKDDIKMTTSVNVEPTTKSGKLSKAKNHELKVTIKTGKATEDFALEVEYGREESLVLRNHAFGRETVPYFAKSMEIKPAPFMRPALNMHVGSVMTSFKKILGDQIYIQAKKQERALKKKGG